jgi:hypothetical protein
MPLFWLPNALSLADFAEVGANCLSRDQIIFNLTLQGDYYMNSYKLAGSTNGQFGGAALEYVLVTTFATLTGLAALGFVGKMIKEKMDLMADRLGVERGDIDWNPFSQNGEH